MGSPVGGGANASGLLYHRSRYYDPVAGQFTQEDPIGLAGGLNLYGYANGDPVNLSDPFGLMAQTDTLVAVTVDQFSSENPTKGLRDVCVDQSVAGNVQPIFEQAAGAGIPVLLNNAYRDRVTAGTGGRPSAGLGSPHLAGFAFDINVKGLSQSQISQFTQIAIANGFEPLAGDLGHFSAVQGPEAVYGSFQAAVAEASRSYAAKECVDANVR